MNATHVPFPVRPTLRWWNWRSRDYTPEDLNALPEDWDEAGWWREMGARSDTFCFGDAVRR